MTVAQCRAARRRMRRRYGGGLRGAISIKEAIEKERQRAARQVAVAKRKRND